MNLLEDNVGKTSIDGLGMERLWAFFFCRSSIFGWKVSVDPTRYCVSFFFFFFLVFFLKFLERDIYYNYLLSQRRVFIIGKIYHVLKK